MQYCTLRRWHTKEIKNHNNTNKKQTDTPESINLENLKRFLSFLNKTQLAKQLLDFFCLC